MRQGFPQNFGKANPKLHEFKRQLKQNRWITLEEEGGKAGCIPNVFHEFGHNREPALDQLLLVDHVLLSPDLGVIYLGVIH